MSKLILIGLAASSAFVATQASAQPQNRGPGHSWERSGPDVRIRHHGQAARGIAHPGANFRHRRLQRGYFVHPYWFGPQFHVQNWQLYGFTAPPRDHRWVRYFDDAYLIDRRGRVADTRHGLDWDEYGEPWGLDDGVPYYEGRGEWHPDDEDYAWAEQSREELHAGSRAPAYGHGTMTVPSCHSGPQHCSGHPHPGYAYPGYGYGIVYPIIIETTVTTSGGCCEEVIEERVVRQRPQRRQQRVVRPRPRPPAGERG